jgi:uncharacterized protein YbjT (DUF2867 family)
MPKILVTGATGNVGRAVVDGLQACGAEFTAAVRDIVRGPAGLPPLTPVVAFDFLDASTHAGAFAGIDRLFLVRPPELDDIDRQIMPALRAGQAAGLRHITFLSLQGVEENSIVPHHRLEQRIVQMGFERAFLRPSFFMQNLSTIHCAEIRDRDEIFVPAGSGRTSFVDVRDIAEIAVRTLCEPGHENVAYELTGRDAPNYFEVASLLSDALGRSIRYANPSLPRFIWRKWRTEHVALKYVLVMSALYTVCRIGKAARVTSEMEDLLGRPPRSLSQFVQNTRAVWER